MNATDVIRTLELVPHPEGGYYREVYRSSETLSPAGLPARYRSERALASAIYFLVTRESPSCFHRLQSDETWCFHYGAPLTLHLLDGNQGSYRYLRLSAVPTSHAHPQATVPTGCWFGATVDSEPGYALVSCLVSPGFDFADFQLASRARLLERWPEQADIILRLTADA